MKAADGFVFKKMRDTGVIVPVGARSFDFHGMVTLNETGALLWELLQTDTTREALVRAVLDAYAVDSETAEQDVDRFLQKLKEAGLLVD